MIPRYRQTGRIPYSRIVSAKCYLIDNNKKCEIYNQYHQSKAEIKWLDEDIVKINDVALDLSKGETFDWRK